MRHGALWARHRQFVLQLEPRRLLSAGDLDTAFGDHGIVTDPLTADFYFVNDTALLPGDKVLIAGEIDPSDDPNPNYFLARYNADGTRDTTFGVGGSVSGQLIGGDQQIEKVSIDSHGRIVVMIVGPPINDTTEQLLVARFNADGSLDTTFSDDGFFAANQNTNSYAVAVDANDNVLVVDGSGLSRYTPTGQLDSTFGNAGLVHPISVEATLHPLPDGKILVAGADSINFAIARLNADGSLDQTFGNNGIATTVVPSNQGESAFFKDLAVLSDGKIVGVGDVDAYGGAAVRYLANGQIDTTFGDNGIRPIHGTQVNQVIVDSTGRIYLAGPVGNVARLTPDGDLDATFGRVFGPGGAESDLFHNNNAVLLSSGRLLIPGSLRPFDGPANIAFVARLTQDDGNPSPITFANGVISISGTDEANDRIVVIDGYSGGAILARINDFGRIFEGSETTLIAADGAGGNDVIDMSGITTLPVHIAGGTGRDKIAGGALNDTLQGNAQRDFIDGGDGDDIINGNGGNDQLRGQNGNDSLGGGRGNDYLEGNDGNDHLEAGAGLDTLHGNAGNDTFVANDGLVDQLFGEDGNDSAVADTVDVLTSIES